MEQWADMTTEAGVHNEQEELDRSREKDTINWRQVIAGVGGMAGIGRRRSRHRE